jgi:hypothetical protein
MNNHRITTWVNDEPVLVCDNVYNGYNQPFWPTLRKGWNTVHFTAERLPEGLTNVIAEHSADRRNDGTTAVKFVKGNILSGMSDILVWNVTDDSQTSPRWTVRSDTAYRPSLDSFEDVGEINDDMREQIAAFLVRLKKALDGKDIEATGWRVSDIDFLAEKGGSGHFDLAEVFWQEYYAVIVSPIDKLKFLAGTKTVMVYRPDGEKVFFAGRSPDAPEEPMEPGKWYHSAYIGLKEIYFVSRNGKLEPLWVKDYSVEQTAGKEDGMLVRERPQSCGPN